MSSQDVVKSVSKKLKYYFQIKRLEDGFDLSAPDCPKLDHPRLRARPTLMYDGLHDRPLKHYFSPHDVRCVLTQFKADGENKGREKTVKKNVHKHLKRYQFVKLYPPPKNQRTPLAETYYCKPRNARERRIRAELTGFGTPLKKSSQPHKGGYPVLRSTPQKYLSKGEAYRIVNNASRLLVATESVGIGGEKNKKDKEEDNKEKKKEKKKSAPKRFESEDAESVQSERSQQRGGKKKSERNSRQEQDHNIYTYDPQGNKVYLTKDDGEDDSTYGTRPSSSSPVTIEGEPADDRKVQPWLKQEMRKQKVKDDEKEYVRPHSSYTPAPPSTPPEGRGRPKSAAHAKKGRGRKNSDDRSDRDSDCKEAWEVRGLDDDEDSKASARSGDAQVQTGGDLLRDYDPAERLITSGERCRYEIRVHTGSRLGSSTKADVKVQLYGDNGRTGDMWLSDSKNHKVKFQKGQEDIFEKDTFYVGPVRKIAIGHDREETGYGWFLDRVQVKDLENNMRYEISCEKWLSSQEGDGRTVKSFPVDYATSFKPEQKVLPYEDYEAESEEKIFISTQVEVQDSDDERSKPRRPKTIGTVSSTSLENNASDAQRVRAASPAHSDTSSSGSSTSGSSTSSSSSDSETTTSATTTPSPQHAPQKPKTPPPSAPRRQPVKRADDFFDQNVPEKDYSSVIDSLSHATDRDNNNDFDADPPNRDGPQGKMTLRESRTKTPDESESVTSDMAVLSKYDMNTNKKKEDQEFMDGFKAGLKAANTPSSDEKTEDDKKEDISSSPRKTVHQLTKDGNLDELKSMSLGNSSILRTTDEHGWTPLHIAASQGHVDIVQWLTIHVADLDIETPTGYAPMHLAAMDGHTKCMMVLNAMGATIDCKSVDKQTPLHLAAKNGNLESVKWLVANRADIDASDLTGQKPQALAEDYDENEVADFLKSCKEEQNNPNSSLAQLRTSQPKSSTGEPEIKDKDKDILGYDSDDHSKRTWQDDQPSSRRESRRGSGSETEQEKKKHDEELMEKKRLYDEQQRKMSTGHDSFLDSIRKEYETASGNP